MPKFSDPPLMWMERAATSKFAPHGWHHLHLTYAVMFMLTVTLHHRPVWSEAVRRPCERLHGRERRGGQHVAGTPLRHEADVPGTAGQRGEEHRDPAATLLRGHAGPDHVVNHKVVKYSRGG